MQLFTRRVQYVGSSSEIVEYAMESRAHVAEATGRDIALWSAGFGAPVGTMVFAVRVDGIADLMSATSGLATDPTHQEHLRRSRELMAGPAEDSLATPLFGELGDSPPVGSFAMVVSAVMAAGKYEEALHWGAEMAAYAQSVTGLPEMFLAGNFGAFGNVTWIGVGPDAATVDQALAKLNSDAEYLKRLGEAGDLFIEGSGNQALLTRIA